MLVVPDIIAQEVFPTHVGMNRWRRMWASMGAGIPHARGDEPECGDDKREAVMYSPRTWG